jgi:hypothetical protein
MLDEEHPGTEEVAGRLEAYASARLAPRRGSAVSMRWALVEEARMRNLEATIGRGRHRHGSGPRRVAALLLAAALGLGTAVVAVAGSGPGGPFYPARIWLNTVALPWETDLRALERIRQIEGLLVDAERAAVSGDHDAIAAAAQAYGDAVDDAVDEVVAEIVADTGANEAPGGNEVPAPGGNEVPVANDDRLVRLEAALGNHVLVLEALADRLPEAAADGITNALIASQKAVEKLGHTKPSDEPGQ